VTEPENGLGLDAVVKRFAESEQTLTAIRERLQVLATSAESSAASTAALDEAAQTVRGFVTAASAVVGELKGVSAQARSVLESGASVLDGSALRDVEQGLVDLKQAIEQSRDALDQRVAALEARLERVDKGVETAYGVLPGRWTKGQPYPSSSERGS
jgi:ABC-type transporter Mla subunit MlaD